MNIILNIFGIGFVAYAIILLVGNAKNDYEEKDHNFSDSEDYDEFNAEEFIDELNSFSKVLNDKQENQYEKESYNNDLIDFNKKNKDVYIPSSRLEKEIDKKEDAGYTSLVKDVSKSKFNNDIGDFNRDIVSLKKVGLTNKEIAKRTGRSVREIEVILKLYSKK